MRKVDSVSAEAKFNGLREHYKDTFEVHLSTIGQRDRLMYVLLSVLALFSLQLTSFTDAGKIFSQVIKESSHVDVSNSPGLIVLSLWFALFAVSTRYYQVCIQIERQYGYLHALEDSLSRHYVSSNAYTREGATYLNEYPLLSNWLHALYTLLLPAFLLYVSWARISDQVSAAKDLDAQLQICFVFYLMSGTTTVLYLGKLHKLTIRKWCAWL